MQLIAPMLRRLNNFNTDDNQEDLYKQIISLGQQDYFQLLTTLDLPPTIRLMSYFRAFNIVSAESPDNWAMDLHFVC